MARDGERNWRNDGEGFLDKKGFLFRSQRQIVHTNLKYAFSRVALREKAADGATLNPNIFRRKKIRKILHKVLTPVVNIGFINIFRCRRNRRYFLFNFSVLQLRLKFNFVSHSPLRNLSVYLFHKETARKQYDNVYQL